MSDAASFLLLETMFQLCWFGQVATKRALFNAALDAECESLEDEIASLQAMKQKVEESLSQLLDEEQKLTEEANLLRFDHLTLFLTFILIRANQSLPTFKGWERRSKQELLLLQSSPKRKGRFLLKIRRRSR